MGRRAGTYQSHIFGVVSFWSKKNQIFMEHTTKAENRVCIYRIKWLNKIHIHLIKYTHTYLV